MARKKQVVIKKKQKTQQVNVKVVVNSHNRRKVSNSHRQPAQVYIPAQANSTPIVLSQHPQPYSGADIATHIENAIKKYAPPATTLFTPPQKVKTLINQSTETQQFPVEIKREERVLSSIPIKPEPGLLQPRRVAETQVERGEPSHAPIERSFSDTYKSRFEKLIDEADKTPNDESRRLQSERRRPPTSESSGSSDHETPYLPNKSEMIDYILRLDPEIKGIQNFNSNELKSCIKAHKRFGIENMIAKIDVIKRDKKRRR